jgi:hypothetical protein
MRSAKFGPAKAGRPKESAAAFRWPRSPAARGNRRIHRDANVRLNEALIVSFGATYGDNLPALDRVVRIARQLDRNHGVSSGARGTEARRKLLETLVSVAKTDPLPRPRRA